MFARLSAHKTSLIGIISVQKRLKKGLEVNPNQALAIRA